MAADAIAMAVSSVANLFSGFVSSSAQKRAYTQGMAVEGVSIERQKSLSAYQGIASNRQTMMFLILGLTAIVVTMLLIKKKNNNNGL